MILMYNINDYYGVLLIMISIYKPEYKDLWFRKEMLEDFKTMSYNHSWGGTIPFPIEKWNDWYDYWITNHDNKRFYRYVKNGDDFVGEIAYHYDSELEGYIANVIIHAKNRGQGYGSEALDLLCSIAKENGITCLYDDIAIDNKAISLFLHHGFKEKYRTDEKIILMKEL